MFDVGKPTLGAVAAFLRSRGLGAGFADRFKRGARGLVGGGKVRFSFGQPVGGGAACTGRGLDLTDQGLTLFGEFLRRVAEFAALAFCFRGALGDRGDLRRGFVLPLIPVLALDRDRLQPTVGKLGFAGNGLRLDAHFGERAAISRDLFVDLGKLSFEIGRVRQFGERFLRVAARRRRLRRDRRWSAAWPRLMPISALHCG